MNPDTSFQFWALLPNSQIEAIIQRIKNEVIDLVGDQLYLTDPPHSTVWLGAFDQGGLPLLSDTEVASLPPLPKIQIDGWKVFGPDPLTGLTTLVCGFSLDTLEKLQQFQQAVVEKVSPRRNISATQERYQEAWSQLGDQERHNIQRNGFPFAGPNWIPHITIASFSADAWPAVWSALKDKCPKGHVSYTRLSQFVLEGNEPRHVVTYELPRAS